MSFNNQRPAGKEEVFNKVKFSSIKMGQTKQGSPTLGLYLKRDQLEKMAKLIGELLEAGEDGCKLSCIVISGKEYDAGYAYVNPKEQRKQEGQANAQSNYSNGRPSSGTGGDFGNKSSARNFFQSKRIDDGKAPAEGN